MPTKYIRASTFKRSDGMGIVPVRWWFESTRCPSHFHSKYSLYMLIILLLINHNFSRQVRENMTVFKLTLFELHNVNLRVKHFRKVYIAHYFVLPLVKVAGFSVGGVMVSTTVWIEVRFLSCRRLSSCSFVIWNRFWVAPSVCEDRWSF